MQKTTELQEEVKVLSKDLIDVRTSLDNLQGSSKGKKGCIPKDLSVSYPFLYFDVRQYHSSQLQYIFLEKFVEDLHSSMEDCFHGSES